MAKIAVGSLSRERDAARPGFGAHLASLRTRLAAALEEEFAWRRPSLWLPVAAGAGALLSLTAEREPSLGLSVILLAAFCGLALVLRARRGAFAIAAALAALAAGFTAQGWRTARVAAPVLARPVTTDVTGFVEQVDLRRVGARFVLRLTAADALRDSALPYRIRLTTQRAPDFAAGDHVGLKARLLPPAHAALPGGYDFARDAYFARIGAVGNALGRIERIDAPEPAPLSLRVFAMIDRYRNTLVERVVQKLPGDTGAIAAAMVAGKRDHLSGAARELIREAGIFHIITISGVQMTLVAGIFFVGLRRLLALSQTLALNYPIKKWAAGLAISGAVAYDLFTGSRVGAERALVMTAIMLAAVIFDRPSLSMRNLAIAALFVIAIEPEALLGASFQLSFAAVAALVAVWEARNAHLANRGAAPLAATSVGRFGDWFSALVDARWSGLGAVLFATLCATTATASFMAADFHELSPYVLVGNPLTLAIIEFFAVPAALLGALLYPLGLDGPVWIWLGFGIDLITTAARWIASAPASTVHLREFAPWALPFLSLAVLSAVIWRTPLLKATAIPLALIGIVGATQGPRWDIAVQASGESAVVRGADGALVALGRTQGFTTEQWLRADADGRDAHAAGGARCDRLGCTAALPDGRSVALVRSFGAFAEDCARADVLVTNLYAPSACGAGLVIDRHGLEETGAVTISFDGARPIIRAARAQGEDRPWSPAPKRTRRTVDNASETGKPPFDDAADERLRPNEIERRF
ncbi:MAG: ComEC/Rec2 family competence protein [Hyphomicrobiales bacterium]|nr:ComEC/Rec2 family competence protein [Hyphomicrobiales bacterium]